MQSTKLHKLIIKVTDNLGQFGCGIIEDSEKQNLTRIEGNFALSSNKINSLEKEKNNKLIDVKNQYNKTKESENENYNKTILNN